MCIEHWINEKLEVKFAQDSIADLGTIVEEYGFVKRTMAVSNAVIEKLGFDNGELAVEQFRQIAIEGDIGAMEALETFFTTESNPDVLDLDRSRYFPSVEFQISLDNGQHEKVMIVVNERAEGVARWQRFIAVLLNDDMEPYSIERTTI